MIEFLVFFFSSRAPPERDHEHLSSTSRLLEKQREVTEAEALLANQKEVNHHPINDVIHSVPPHRFRLGI